MATNWYYEHGRDDLYGNRVWDPERGRYTHPNLWDNSLAMSFVGTKYLENNPNFAYVRRLGQMGAPDDESPFARWLRSQYARTQQGFGAAFAQNPALSYSQGPNSYLKGLGGLDAWKARFQSLTPSQRGEQNTNFAPVTRTLRWS